MHTPRDIRGSELATSLGDDVIVTSGFHVVSNEESQWVLVADMDNMLITLAEKSRFVLNSTEFFGVEYTKYALPGALGRPDIVFKLDGMSREIRWWKRCIMPMAGMDARTRADQARIDEHGVGIWDM